MQKPNILYWSHRQYEKRLAEHAAGMSDYTSKRLPVKLIYLEQFQTRDQAFVEDKRVE